MPDSFTSVGVKSLLRVLPELPRDGGGGMRASVRVDRLAVEDMPMSITLTMSVREWREHLRFLSPAGDVTGLKVPWRVAGVIKESVDRFDRACNFEYEVGE